MVDILSGHNIPHSLTPIYRRGGGGGGSFQSPPFVFRDSVLESNVSIHTQMFVRFTRSLDSVGGQLQWRGPDGTSVGEQFPGAPLQYWEGLPGSPPPEFYSMRRTVNLGPDDIVSGDLKNLGVWVTAGSNGTAWTPFTGAPPDTVENTSTYELSKSSDTSVVLARANITILHHRI